MKFCPPHWAALREMIVAKGMGGLISSDAPVSLSDWMRDLDVDDFPSDPLISAWFMLCGRAVYVLGLELLENKLGDGTVEYCPLCEVEEAGLEDNGQSGLAQGWMEGCTDSILVYCRNNNLLPREQ